MLYSILPQSSKSFSLTASDLHPILRSLLFQRGIRTKDDIDEFLNPRYENSAYDPFQFLEMKKAVERLRKAAELNERIIIYGDYDVDGVASSILMLETLETLYKKICLPTRQDDKRASVGVYLPHREDEGYGLNPKAVSYIKEHGAALLITCDCGSGNKDELSDLQKAGIDVIILDHHVAPLERPPSFAFINPKFKNERYPYRDLSAGGVVFKVIQALRKLDYISESFEKWSLDLVALSTVADMMPLLKENRTLVKWGLMVLNKTRRVGMQALIRSSRIQKILTTYDISYALAPRINSAGRLDHANVAFDLLRQTNKESAEHEAMNLNQTNEARQKLTEKILEEAKRQIQEQYERHDRTLLAYNLNQKTWPMGVLGLVAGKIAKEYYRPVFVIAQTNHGISGSGRSIPAFDLTALLDSVRDLLEKYGGHPQACGFTLKNMDDPEATIQLFKSRIEEYGKQYLKESDLLPTITISSELAFSDITLEFIEDLERLEPYGQENTKPLFLTRNVQVLSSRTMGKKNNHCKLLVSAHGARHEAVVFCAKDHIKEITSGDFCDIIYNLEQNEWNGETRIQLMIRELERV